MDHPSYYDSSANSLFPYDISAPPPANITHPFRHNAAPGVASSASTENLAGPKLSRVPSLPRNRARSGIPIAAVATHRDLQLARGGVLGGAGQKRITILTVLTIFISASSHCSVYSCNYYASFAFSLRNDPPTTNSCILIHKHSL